MTVALALVDFLPVLLYLISVLVLEKRLYRRLGRGGYSMFAAGTGMVMIAGTYKAIWKLLYALQICDFQRLNLMFFPLQATGFLLAGISIFSYACNKTSGKTYVFTLPVLAAVGETLGVYDGTMLCVVMMILGVAGVCGGFAVISSKYGKKRTMILFLISLFLLLGMGYMSSKDFDNPNMHWIAEGLNTVAQIVFLAASIDLCRIWAAEDKRLANVDFALNKLRETYRVQEKNLGEYGNFHKGGKNFEIHAYDVENAGNLCTVSMSAILGLMKMNTVVFTPLSRDMPLFSYDRILAMGNDTLLVELYDTTIEPCDVTALNAVKESYKDLPDYNLGEHWYDYMKMSPSLAKRGKRLGPQFKQLREVFFERYVALLSCARECNPQDKRVKTAEYVDGLFSNGGPSTDQFKKILGEEKAKELFSKYIFASMDSNEK